MDNETFDQIRFLSSDVLTELLHQMKIDPEKFEDDILKIEQELVIRSVSYCKPIIDLV